MNPIYKFELSKDGTTFRRVYPVYKDDLAKDYQLQQNEQFYRASLSGKLTFQNDDYTFINSSAFETEFELHISISYDTGQTWALYWVGRFWKTDCEFNDDDQTIIVQPEVYDEYNDVLAGMEKEYNLIELLPEIDQIQIDKRPMIQIYVPGDTVIACFLSGMYWEQDCESVTDETELTQDYYFAKCASQRVIDLSGNTTPALPAMFNGAVPQSENQFEYTQGGYKLRFIWAGGSSGSSSTWQIIRESDSAVLWYFQETNRPIRTLPYTVTLQPVSGTGATGTVELYIHDINVYGRYITDVLNIGQLSTYPMPADDLVENNRNYSRVIGYAFNDAIYFSDRITNTPTQWGLYQPGQYYQQPYLYWNPTLFPVAKSAWSRLSVWFAFSMMDWIVEQQARQTYTLKDTYPLASVISVLLAKIAPGITHEAATDYSQFLYGTNPITGTDYRLFITQKSNILAGNYDQPAQKAPATLKQITDMLRDCFRCYWFIDNGKFRIEHIEYFRNGGSYFGAPVVGIDLTQQQVTRNGKKWAFATSKYTFDKPEMPTRYQFGWMDDVTQPFEGFPIDIISKYVTPGNIEEITISNFTSDVDYMLLNPSACSNDGFALLAAIDGNAIKMLKYYQGSLSATIGGGFNPTTSNTRIRTGLILMRSKRIGVTGIDGSTYRILADVYDENKILLYNSRWQTNNFEFVQNDGHFVAFVISRVDGGNITPEDANRVLGNIRGIGLQLPYIQLGDNILQNGYVAFKYLQQYYLYDMPAYNVEIGGNVVYVQGIKKLKNQTLKFPAYTDPDLTHLIKTNMGNGTIEKISINLSSRNANATLRYDTE